MSDLIITGKAKPQYFLPGNVLEAAKKRIHWIFDEFDNHVSVSTSGGKDSTVVLELALQVAHERGLLGIKAHFLDQESEYQATVDYMRRTADRPDIDLDWYQIPFRLFNATSHSNQWSMVWDPALDDSEWIRPKEPDSIHENEFGKDRFKEILHAMNVKDGGAILTGMRSEESPTRRVFMTSVPSYKWATWCSGPGAKLLKKGADGPYLFHPIYDWTYRDVWKSIHQHQWDYNTFYDAMFQRGVRLRAMRVSSFHHEQSQGALDYLQEIEPETWERATRRIQGVNTYRTVGEQIAAHYMHNLPYMFSSWIEYTDYLIDNLVENDDNRLKFRKMWTNAEATLPWVPRIEIARTMLYMVMFNDVYGSNMNAWLSAQKHPNKKREWERWKMDPKNNYDPAQEEGRYVRIPK